MCVIALCRCWCQCHTVAISLLRESEAVATVTSLILLLSSLGFFYLFWTVRVYYVVQHHIWITSHQFVSFASFGFHRLYTLHTLQCIRKRTLLYRILNFCCYFFRVFSVIFSEFFSYFPIFGMWLCLPFEMMNSKRNEMMWNEDCDEYKPFGMAFVCACVECCNKQMF